MRILIVSDSPWRRDNSFGNTYSNRFSRIPEIEIAHVYTLGGTPDYEPNIKAYFQIPENQVIRSVLSRKVAPAGHVVRPDAEIPSTDSEKRQGSSYSKLLAFGKRHHWMSMFFAREAAWRMGKIDWDALLSFAKDFNPDIVFLPIFYTYYTNRIGLFLKRALGVPMVLEISMDYYTFKRLSFNPLFWIDRVFKRKMIRRLVSEASLMYVISRKLKEEYEGIFDLPIKVLYKVPDPGRVSSSYQPKESGPLSFIYTGNLYANRWKSLSLLAEELAKTGAGILDIYTATPVTSKMSNALNIKDVSFIHAPVSQEEVIRIQNSADVLVHVESFDYSNKLLVRYAISTKVMDYLNTRRCILAIGPEDVASMEYLCDNDIALVAENKKTLSGIIYSISKDRSIVSRYARRCSDFVGSELDPNAINSDLLDDLKSLVC